MRKLILFVVIILFILTIVNNEKDEEIRVRIIPNSNNEYDLKIKNKVTLGTFPNVTSGTNVTLI